MSAILIGLEVETGMKALTILSGNWQTKYVLVKNLLAA
jgi:hypothetical protein